MLVLSTPFLTIETMSLLGGLLKGTGFSFSWKRLLGVTAARTKVSRKIGVPTTRYGVERKIGASFLDLLFGSSKKKRKKRR